MQTVVLKAVQQPYAKVIHVSSGLRNIEHVMCCREHDIFIASLNPLTNFTQGYLGALYATCPKCGASTEYVETYFAESKV